MFKFRFVILTISLILISSSSLSTSIVGSTNQQLENDFHVIAQTQTDLTGISIGIYEGYIDYFDPRINQSRTALINMFQWMNATVRVFNTTDILNGSLWSCEVLAVPEGLGPRIERQLTDAGLQTIRDWVAAGGSYIGVRGSAAMAVQYSYFEGIWTEFNLAMINGTSYQVEGLDVETMTNVSINRECTGPDLSNMPENLTVLFRTGRYILPNEGQELIYIANYTHNSLPAMVAAYYGQGTLFISSPHFEYEEDSDRDGTDYMDEYDDPDSEWSFMLTITQWLIDSTPTVCNLTEWPIPTPASNLNLPIEIILVGGGLGIAVIIAIAVYVKRR